MTMVTAFGQAGEALHHRIDQVFMETATGPVAGLVDDLTFARRIHLDLTGRIPSAEETRRFLADDAPDRRIRLVDHLLASDEFPRHMAVVFDVMLMERRGGKHVKTSEFRAWLEESFRRNKPFHTLAGELMAADPSGDQKPASAFLMERDLEPNLLTREISRMFLGMDLQCAQCHNHPNVDDYKQEDYYGLFASVSRLSLFQADKKKPALIAESADGLAPFKSVFTDRQAFTAPRLPGEPEAVEPVYAAGDEYKVRPSKTTAGVPTYSRRAWLAESLAKGTNPYFRRNIANRLWALVMGRGLVHPVDMHHSMNPPSNPALMDLLADEIAAMNFDVRGFLRELVLTDVYRRAHQFSSGDPVSAEQLTARIQELEQQRAAANEASAQKEAEAEQALEQLDTAIAAAEPLRAAWVKARAAASTAADKRQAAVAAEQTKKTTLQQKQQVAADIAAALKHAQEAATLLGQPPELAAVSATLKSRTEKLSAETQKLKTEFEAAAKAAAAAIDSLTKANTAEQAEREKLQPLQVTMREHRSRLVQALKESQRAYERVTWSEQKAEFLQQLIARQQAETELPARAQAHNSTRQQLAQATASVESAEQNVTAMTEQMATALDDQKSLQQQLTVQQSQLTEQQQVSSQLAESLASLQRAIAALPDEELQTLSSKLAQSSERAAAKMGQVQTELDGMTQRLTESEELVETLRAQASEAQQQAEAARQKVEDATEQLTQLQQQLTELKATAEESNSIVLREATRQFQLAPVESLTPEQLAWSALQASGQIDQQIAAELAKLNKEKPLTDEQQKDAAVVANRQKAAKQAARTALDKTVASFVSLFAAETGQPQDSFFATVDQALFLANGGQVRSWLNPAGNNLTARLLKLESASELAKELYLSVLVRPPAPEEISDVEAYLAARGDQRSAAVQELAWALITSAEFRFQY
ncbi:MAG: DUF1549 domain-containing protein [Fuerstiella sp.]